MNQALQGIQDQELFGHQAVKCSRITTRLVDYWNEIRGDRLLPMEDDIDPEALKDLWDNCFLIHTYDIGKGSDYNYTFLGSNILRSYASELTQDNAPPLASPSAEKLAALYDRVLRTQSPVIEHGWFLNVDGHEIRYRQCLLPFGADGTVTSIFGGMRYKILK